MSHVVALLACHNRRDRTVACLRSLFAQELRGHRIEAVLVDDGSTDGTGAAARALSDQIEVIQGDGSLYWARAMALAEQRAITRSPDYLLWLNDDVVLRRDALATMLAARDEATDERIVVGAVADPDSGALTYGGVRRVDWHPMRYALVASENGKPHSCTTMNGNVVLVPRPVYLAVGGIDGAFGHAYADYDYGLRARELGLDLAVTGAAVGTCSRGPELAWTRPGLSLVDKYRLLLDRKGVPFASSARYLRRHGGRLWPIYFAATYVKVAVEHVRARMRVARIRRSSAIRS
jgi:GT2 family glycosyltransferase